MMDESQTICASFDSAAGFEKFQAWQKWAQEEYLPFAEPPHVDTLPSLTTLQMGCECIHCTQERRRRGVEAAHDSFANPNRSPDDRAMDRDEYHLLPGSLAFNRDWSIFMAGRRFVGGEPIDFKSILQQVYQGKAKDALYADLVATQAALDAGYLTDVLDRSGLDDTIVEGGWMVITDYARTKGAGSRTARDVMRTVGLLQSEIEVRMAPMLTADPSDYLGITKPDYRTTLRLAAWATLAGLGRRMKSFAGIDFDVLSPDGVAWLNARWPKPIEKSKAKRGRPSTLREEVQRLLGEGKTQAEIARLLGKSRQIVSHHAKALATA